MAASFRFLDGGKRLPYLTALKAVTREPAYTNDRRISFQYGDLESLHPVADLPVLDLDGTLRSRLALETIGYEDKIPLSEKPKPSHPGEYVTAWDKYQPKPSTKPAPKALNHKRRAPKVLDLKLRPEDRGDMKSEYRCQRQKALDLLSSAFSDGLEKASVGTAVLSATGKGARRKSMILEGISIDFAGVTEASTTGRGSTV